MSIRDFVPLILAVLVGIGWLALRQLSVQTVFLPQSFEQSTAQANLSLYTTHVEETYEMVHSLHPETNVSIYRYPDSINTYRCASDSIMF